MRIPLDRGPAVWSRRRQDRDRQPPAGARNVRHARCSGRGFPKSAASKAEATIIGVAADAHSIKVGANNVVELYVPLKPADFSEVFLVARARSDADRLLPILREAATIDPRVIPTARAMHDDFDREMQGPRMASAIAGGIGVLTLALACLGIFGVVSYGVALRTKEIGIRVALGAQQPALLRAIVRQVLTPVGIGVVIGLVLAIPAGMVAAIGAVLPGERRSDCVCRGAGGVRRRRRGGGVVAGVPGAAQQSGRRVTAFVDPWTRCARSRQVARHDFAADHRHQHLRVAQPRLGAGERILAEDHEVRELARLDRSLRPLFHRQPRVVDRRHAQRLLRA